MEAAWLGAEVKAASLSFSRRAGSAMRFNKFEEPQRSLQ